MRLPPDTEQAEHAWADAVCRYVARPPVPDARLHLRDDGRVQLALRRPYPDPTRPACYNSPSRKGRL